MELSNEFYAGYKAGQEAGYDEMSPIDMVAYDDDFQVGYALGFGFVQSVRMASPSFGAQEAGRLARLYRLTSHPDAFANQYYRQEPDVIDDFVRGYEDQREAEMDCGH